MQAEILDIIDELKDNKPKNLNEYLNDVLLGGKVVIYGAGGFGREIYGVLKNNNVTPEAFFDIKAIGSIFDIPIIHPADYQNKNVVVVLSIVLDKKTRAEIISFLEGLGYKKIIDAQKIRAMYVELEGEHSYEFLKANQEAILKPLEFLADEESKETYKKNIIAHLSRNYEDVAETEESEQYFVSNIPFSRGFSRFVDCGAYIGDTFLKLLEQNSNVEEYIGFEPIKENFEKLSQALALKKVKAVVIPAAVSENTGFVKFDSMLGSSAANEKGETLAMSVKLDDVLHNYNSVFLKMDIEGEEIKALNGAKNFIVKNKPELAICVYHYINHFWEIPNMLYSWNLGYKFYLRTHSSACMETVLYAVRGEELCQ